MQRHAPSFPLQLQGFSFEALEREQHSVFAISPDFELLYFNEAYVRFAEENAGVHGALSDFPIGANTLDAVTGVMREFYEERFAHALTSRTPWHHDYTCLSPERWREFRQGVYPLKNDSGLVLINTLKVDVPVVTREPVALPPIAARYLQSTGLITQCSNCRRTQRGDGSEAWDWVPDWVTAMPRNTSHSICPPCFDYYWKFDDRSLEK